MPLNQLINSGFISFINWNQTEDIQFISLMIEAGFWLMIAAIQTSCRTSSKVTLFEEPLSCWFMNFRFGARNSFQESTKLNCALQQMNTNWLEWKRNLNFNQTAFNFIQFVGAANWNEMKVWWNDVKSAGFNIFLPAILPLSLHSFWIMALVFIF